MTHLFTTCAAAAALLTSLAAAAMVPTTSTTSTASTKAPITTAVPKRLDAADSVSWPVEAATHAPKAEPSAAEAYARAAPWLYCGFYTRPDGRTGIKCYAL